MLEDLKREVWECNLMLPKYNLVVMTSGNASGRDPDSHLVVIKPSGYSYEKLTPEDMVVVDLYGKVVEGKLRPSLDTDTHLYVYHKREDINGIVHTHSIYASSFAAAGEPIPACLTTCGMLGGEVPVGDYVPIGGKEIGAEIIRKIGNKLAIVMKNHGIFTIGRDVRHATKLAVEIENIAKIIHLAMTRSKIVPLSDKQVQAIVDLYKKAYGQR